MSITWKLDESKNNLWNDDKQTSLIKFIEELSKWYEDGFTDLGKIYISVNSLVDRGELLDIENENNSNKWLEQFNGVDDVHIINIDHSFDDYNKGYWQEELESLISSILVDEKNEGYKFLHESSCFWACTHRVDGSYSDWSKEALSNDLVWSDWSYGEDDEDDE